MPRYTLGQFKTLYSWPEFLNLDSSDARWLLILNEAVERLMNAGLWCGTYQRYRVCTANACLTWPRAFQTIEVVDVCGEPTTIRNQWFEFIDQGPGLWRGGAGCCSTGLNCPTYNYLDRGRGYVMFDDTRAAASRLRFTTQFAADAGKVVNVRGYDSTGNWVLTNAGNTVGEDVVLSAGSVDTVTEWGPQVFREVIKAVTKGFVTVNSYDVAVGDSVLYPMARWEPGETVPDYRRCVIPALANAAGCGGVGEDGAACNPTVTVMAKLAFIPLASDLDILPLSNGPAIKMAMISVLKQERGDAEGARAAMWGSFDGVSRRWRDGAMPLLEEELAVFNGSGAVSPLRLERGLSNAGVLNLV